MESRKHCRFRTRFWKREKFDFLDARGQSKWPSQSSSNSSNVRLQTSRTTLQVPDSLHQNPGRRPQVPCFGLQTSGTRLQTPDFGEDFKYQTSSANRSTNLKLQTSGTRLQAPDFESKGSFGSWSRPAPHLRENKEHGSLVNTKRPSDENASL